MSHPIPQRMRFEVFERDLFTCQYCGARAPNVSLHVDHVIPVSLGGETHNDNLVTACSGCNLGKGAIALSVVPDHIRASAESSYDRGMRVRELVSQFIIPPTINGTPVEAPASVLKEIDSEAQAVAVSMQAAGAKLAYVAAALGRSESYISLIRAGKRPVPQWFIKPFCHITGTLLLQQYIDLQAALASISHSETASDVVSRLAQMLEQVA